MATMKDIASLAGVSIATVSYVLNDTKSVTDEVRTRVMKAVEQTHYQPNVIAKSLRMNKTNIIGVLVEDICGMPVAGIVDGISECLYERGYQVLLYNLRFLQKLHNQYDQLTKYMDIVNAGMRLMENAHVDGVVYVAMHDRRISGVQHPVRIPMVYAYAMPEDSDIPYVTYDNEHSAYQMTRLLIEQGHRRIALVAGHAASTTAQKRLSGFRAAMDDADLYVPAEYIRWGDWEYPSGVEQGTELMKLNVRPTAIFAMNDTMAAGCYRAIKNHGLRIPADISVVGFDNREIAYLINPPMTTMELPNKQIGFQAANLLLARLKDSKVAVENIVLPCSIVQRESTARY